MATCLIFLSCSSMSLSLGFMTPVAVVRWILRRGAELPELAILLRMERS